VTANSLKVVFLFTAGGFGAGLATCMLIENTPIGAGVFLFGVGCVFALGVGGSLIVALAWSLHLSRPSLKGYAAFLIIATLAYPLSILVMVRGSSLFCLLCRALLPSVWRRLLAARCGDQDIELGLWFAAIVAALLVSWGLRIVTGIWDAQISILFVVGGIGTVAASLTYGPLELVYRRLGPFPDKTLLLFVLGDTVFTALSGQWLARAALGQALKKVKHPEVSQV